MLNDPEKRTIIEINGKPKKVIKGEYSNFGISVFCLFCGNDSGVCKNSKHLQEVCEKKGWKKKKHPDYNGERWICKSCCVKLESQKNEKSDS